MPDIVERFLQRGEYRRRADHQAHDADHGGGNSFGLLRVFHRFEQHFGGGASEQLRQCVAQLPIGDFRAYDPTGEGEQDDQQRRQRKRAEKSQRGARAR